MRLSGPSGRHTATHRPATALLACLALSLGACSPESGAEDPDGPEPVAEQLAERLSEHTLTQVPVLDTSDVDAHAELVAPLDDRPVAVEVADVTEPEADGSGERAEARLSWTWDLDGTDWSYETTTALVGTDGDWTVDWTPATVEPSLTDGDRLGAFAIPAARGRITGAQDAPIVVDRPVRRFGVDKSRIVPEQVRASARQVARAVGVDVAPYVQEAVAAGDAAFVEAIVLRADEARDVITPAYGEIPGAVVIGDEIPLAPTREFAAPILGRVGPATAELVEDSDGRIEAGDDTGLSGLQLRYDEELAARDGLEVVAARGEGSSEVRRTLVEVDPADGDDLRTTLVPRLQTAAEEVLADVGPASAIVALRPSDGHVLAAASGPGSEGFSTATEGQYAPGSTFKVVTSLALLRAGVTPSDTLPCPASIDVDGRDFTNYDDYPASGIGDITLRQALANSCNTAFIGGGERLDDDALATAAAALGLGEDADVGYPSYFGEVPAPDGATDAAASRIGQGRVLASPLAMAAVAASVAAGEVVVPTLLPAYETEASEPADPLTGDEARTLRELMRAVVTDGSGSFLADVGGEVGAKTGTAEYGEPDGSGELPTHAWMIATRGDLAVAVFVETGQSGSATVGPLLEAFLRRA